MTIGFSVSAFIGPTSAGFLIDGPGNRLAFCLFAVLPMIAFVWQGLISARLIDQRAEPPAADSPQRLRDLLVTADMRRLYVVVVLISSAWEVNQFVVPLYCTKIGISASGIGLILGAFAVATLVVRMVVRVAGHCRPLGCCRADGVRRHPSCSRPLPESPPASQRQRRRQK